MNYRSRHTGVLAAYFALAIPLLCGSGVATADNEIKIGGPLPKVILDQWRERQKITRMYCRMQCKRYISPEAYGPIVDDMSAELRDDTEYRLWIDFALSKLRLEVDRSPSLDAEVGKDVFLFDGAESQTWEPDRKALILLDEKKRSKAYMLEECFSPVLYGCGILAGPDCPGSPLDLPCNYDPKTFSVKSVAEDSIRISFRPYRNVPAISEIEVDTTKQGLIVGRTRYADDGKLLTTERIIPKQTALGWMPATWEMKSFTDSGNVMTSFDCQLLEETFDGDFADVVFSMTPVPGQVFRDEILDKNMKRSSDGKTDIPYETTVAMEQQSPWRTWLAILGCLSLIGIAFYLHRKGIA